MDDSRKTEILAYSLANAEAVWAALGYTPNPSRGRGDGWGCPNGHGTPGHTPATLYLDADRSRIHCHDCGLGGDVLAVAGKLWGTQYPATRDRLCNMFNVRAPETPARPAAPVKREPLVEECAYDYREADGTIQFQVVRFKPKTFRQRHPSGDGWKWGLTREDGTEVTPILYRLPELSEAEDGALVLIVEGEKDVETALAAGRRATCNPMGAGKAGLVDWAPLAGMQVVVIADKDEAGRGHARDVEAHARKAGADVVGIVECPFGKDLTEHIEAGGTIEEIIHLAILTKTGAEISLDHVYSRSGVGIVDGLPADRIPTGFKKFDEATLGIGRNWLVSLQALQGAGKSTLAYQWAVYAARKGKKILILSTEMTPAEIKETMAVNLSGVSRNRLALGLHDHEEEQVRAAEREIDGLPLLFDSMDGSCPDPVAEFMKRIRGCDLAIIDHVTSLGLSVETANKSTWKTELAAIKALSKLVKERLIPVIAIGHLNRQAQAARARGEGQGIEYGSGAFQIHTESALSLVLEHPKGLENRNKRILRIEKARYCPTGRSFALTFDGDKAHFIEEDFEPEPVERRERNRWGGRDDE